MAMTASRPRLLSRYSGSSNNQDQNADSAAWWKRSSSNTPSHPMRRRRTNEDAQLGRQTSLPMRRSTSEHVDLAQRAHLHYRDHEAVTYQSPTFQEMQAFKNSAPSPTMPVPAPSTGPGEAIPEPERKAIADALRENEQLRREQLLREEKEHRDLEAALAESTRTARLESEQEKERVEIARAVLESQRLAIHEQRRRVGLPDIAPPPTTIVDSLALADTSDVPEEPPPDLEESERTLVSRNEKGGIWSEAALHGWLPPGASHAESVEQRREREMLDLAIRISLEEEEARRRQAPGTPDASSSSEGHHTHSQDVPPPIPPKPAALTALQSSGEASSSTAPPPALPPRPNAPRRPMVLSVIPPGRPKGWVSAKNDGSPEEMPFLSPSTSSHHLPELEDDEGSAKFNLDDASSGAVPFSPQSNQQTWEDSDSASTEHDSPLASSSGHLNSRRSSESVLSVRNPDPTSPLSEEPAAIDSSGASPFPSPYESQLAGRSMSLISERTEPPETRPPTRSNSSSLEGGNDSFNDGGTISTLSPKSSMKRNASIRATTIRQASIDEEPASVPQLPAVAAAIPAPPEEKAAIQTGLSNAENEDEDDDNDSDTSVFGDTVRFGFLGYCDAKHDCPGDGLHGQVPMFDDIVLTHFEDTTDATSASAFTIEARSWVALLRFLMWYGDAKIAAGKPDRKRAASKRCDAAMSLEFRRDSRYDCVVRLTISLLSADHSHRAEELVCYEAPPTSVNGKGKAVDRLFDPPVCFALPDHLLLPARLSTVAISLYTLRQLSSMAMSTQPSQDAAPSFHAMRTLFTCIRALSTESDLAQNNTVSRTAATSSDDHQQPSQAHSSPDVVRSDDESAHHSNAAGVDDDRLIGRLRTRLRRMRRTQSNRTASSDHSMTEQDRPGAARVSGTHHRSPSGNSSAASNRNRLSKAPSYLEKTHTVKRKHRVLGESEDLDSWNDGEPRHFLPATA